MRERKNKYFKTCTLEKLHTEATYKYHNKKILEPSPCSSYQKQPHSSYSCQHHRLTLLSYIIYGQGTMPPPPPPLLPSEQARSQKVTQEVLLVFLRRLFQCCDSLPTLSPFRTHSWTPALFSEPHSWALGRFYAFLHRTLILFPTSYMLTLSSAFSKTLSLF